jgi:hypothetical protein
LRAASSNGRASAFSGREAVIGRDLAVYVQR